MQLPEVPTLSALPVIMIFLVSLAKAQETCPKDPEVQRLFGYTYEQKGDLGFACIRYNKALSFGLSGSIASKTKKIMSDLNCQ